MNSLFWKISFLKGGDQKWKKNNQERTYCLKFNETGGLSPLFCAFLTQNFPPKKSAWNGAGAFFQAIECGFQTGLCILSDICKKQQQKFNTTPGWNLRKVSGSGEILNLQWAELGGKSNLGTKICMSSSGAIWPPSPNNSAAVVCCVEIPNYHLVSLLSRGGKIIFPQTPVKKI